MQTTTQPKRFKPLSNSGYANPAGMRTTTRVHTMTTQPRVKWYIAMAS